LSKAVEIGNLHWRYPAMGETQNPWAIQGVHLEIEPGEVLGITGHSGAGKTTLCRLIMGIYPHGTKIPFRQVNRHIRGRVNVFGETVTEIDENANVVDGTPLGAIRGAGVISPRVGMVMQDPENQFLQMSLLQELAFGLSLQNVPPEDIRSRAKEALEWVGLGELWPNADHIHPLDLSGGQKQRVAIAAFLALSPELLILDEPTSDLDPLGKYQMIQTIRHIKEMREMTIVLVELDPELLYEFCDRVVLLDEGRIVSSAAPQVFFQQLDMLEERGVASFEVTQIAHRLEFASDRPLPLRVEDAVPVLATRRWRPPPSCAPAKDAEPLLEVSNVHYRYSDGTLALQGVDLEVAKGEMVALLGINGGGKTTLAKILAGLYTPTSGSVSIGGKNLASRRVRREIPKTVGYVFQNPDHQLFTRRVYDEVAYGLENLGVPAGERDRLIRETLALIELDRYLEEDPLFLGKGQRQRLAVASVLAMQPNILIVDEPTTGQDFLMTSSIMRLLKELHDQGKTLIVITHDMTIVGNYCERAVVLKNGTTAFDGPPRELFSREDLLVATHLRPTQAFRLSLAMRKRRPGFPLLLNVNEWVGALGEKTLQGASENETKATG